MSCNSLIQQQNIIDLGKKTSKHRPCNNTLLTSKQRFYNVVCLLGRFRTLTFPLNIGSLDENNSLNKSSRRGSYDEGEYKERPKSTNKEDHEEGAEGEMMPSRQ